MTEAEKPRYEHTPTTEAVRNAYVRQMRGAFVTSEPEAYNEFDRWLASIRLESEHD